ncbi:MAG: c-type cytochrome [Rhodospirillaceae bacterium]|nr:c-type cytochrome [Rhodospirillaceae bacterium]MBT3928724.1 c-type cytochrome [Rhodospirillaceae bacterium]MBT5038129.1 c-type cytochrome [Rhodospirillaceae bacterium]MBT5677313.1 c-type cytochrome [Rhodospirillaceae bacterium]MBT5781178.1 c-type cytochrome [Rhodospirillaceae bacterium]
MQRGKNLFRSTGCAACHTPRARNATSIPASETSRPS